MSKPADVLTITEARTNLLQLAERFQRDPAATVSITKRGKPVMTLVSAAAFDALTETLEILADPQARDELRNAIREVEGGKRVAWSEARKKLLG
jgi:prevent-host-death family protein